MYFASLHAYLLFSRLSGSATTETILSCLRFYISTQVSPVSHIVYTTSLGIFALLRLSSALPYPDPRLPSLGSAVCFVCVCARAYSITCNPCHPSYYMPLALVLLKGDQWYLLQHLLDRSDKGALYVYICFTPWTPCASVFLPLCSLDTLGRHLLNQNCLVYVFPPFHPPFRRFP